MRRFILALAYVLLAGPAWAQTMQTHVPTTQVLVPQWQASGGVTDVDDPVGTPDDDTTYILGDGDLGGSGGSSRFTSASPTIPAGSTSISVLVKWRYRETAGNVSAVGLLFVNSTQYTGSTCENTGTYVDCSSTWATNPNTAAAWTVDDVNGTGAAPLQQFGHTLSGIGAGEDARVTQVYLEIDYTPPASGGGAAGTCLLLGVC